MTPYTLSDLRKIINFDCQIAQNDWFAVAIWLFGYKNLPFTICCDMPNEICESEEHNKF